MHGPFMIRAEDTPACRSPSGTHFAPELHLRSRSVSWRALYWHGLGYLWTGEESGYPIALSSVL